MKKTWKAPWGIPNAVVSRGLETIPLMMSLPNYLVSLLCMGLEGKRELTLATPPLIVSFNKVKTKRIHT